MGLHRKTGSASQQGRTDMDYKEQIETLKNLEVIAYGHNINGEVLGMDCSDFEQIMVDAADSITCLLARAEAAEKELLGLQEENKIWSETCSTLANLNQNLIAEKEVLKKQAEKTENERDCARAVLRKIVECGNREE